MNKHAILGIDIAGTNKRVNGLSYIFFFDVPLEEKIKGFDFLFHQPDITIVI